MACAFCGCRTRDQVCIDCRLAARYEEHARDRIDEGGEE